MNIVESGPINEVKNDYVRHKRNFSQYSNKIGYCAVFDGDHKDHPSYSNYHANTTEKAMFLYPYEAPEKFLVRAYLNLHPHQELNAALAHSDHHGLFQAMVSFSLAADEKDARSLCYAAFSQSPDFVKHESDIRTFLIGVTKEFSSLSD